MAQLSFSFSDFEVSAYQHLGYLNLSLCFKSGWCTSKVYRVLCSVDFQQVCSFSDKFWSRCHWSRVSWAHYDFFLWEVTVKLIWEGQSDSIHRENMTPQEDGYFGICVTPASARNTFWQEQVFIGIVGVMGVMMYEVSYSYWHQRDQWWCLGSPQFSIVIPVA